MQQQIDKQRVSLQKARDSIGTWGHLHVDRFAMTRQVAGHTILDVGCSSGNYVRALRQLGYASLGCDILEDAKWRHNQVFTCADLCALPYLDSSFDTLIAFEVLEHIPHVEKALDEMYRVCRQNIVISVPNCETTTSFKLSGLVYHHWVDRTHVQQFTPISLRQTLEKHNFSVKEIKYINPVFPELLVLEAWHLPSSLAFFLARQLNKLPMRKKDHMTILVHAVKRH